MKEERISSLKDIGLCIKTMIFNRYNKQTKIIYTPGKYNSLYVSFYKNHAWQFYVQDKNGLYVIYLLKNDKVAKKDYIKRGDKLSTFYSKIVYFFRMI